jgi:two-component system, chemotaxis family, protein-glutamate methylesterase/glutaminase
MAAAERADREPARRAHALAAPEHRIEVVVPGASAGGLEPLRRLLGRLPPSFDAAVFLVLPIAASRTSALPAILDRAGPLPVADAVEGGRIAVGRGYTAFPFIEGIGFSRPLAG